MADERTPFGFTFGSMEVTRLATLEVKGGVQTMLQVSTPFHELDLYASPTGRSLRVFSGGEWLSPANAEKYWRNRIAEELKAADPVVAHPADFVMSRMGK